MLRDKPWKPSPTALEALAAVKGADHHAPEYQIERRFNWETGMWECPALALMPLQRSKNPYWPQIWPLVAFVLLALGLWLGGHLNALAAKLSVAASIL
jgi:hypothetical protein